MQAIDHSRKRGKWGGEESVTLMCRGKGGKGGKGGKKGKSKKKKKKKKRGKKKTHEYLNIIRVRFPT